MAGMGKATPVFLYRRVSVKEAVDAVAKLHTAILNSDND
jgi:hypothetical protein